MKAFMWNIVLAIVWAAAVGEFSLSNFLMGFVFAYLVLGFAQPLVGESNYYGKVGKVVRFMLFYLWQLVLANVRVAYDVLTPTYYMRPGIVALPLEVDTDEEVTLLANLIALTPGSLCLDVSADRRTMYVHVMFIDDLEEVRRHLKDDYEKPVLELLR